MSWTAVARKDFQDSIRVRWFWALAALFVIFAGGAAYLFAEVIQTSGQATGLEFIVLLSSATGLLVPIIGLMLGYKTIAGERESGSLKLLLSLPHTRAEVVAGKLVGRSAVISVAILIGYAVAVAIGLALFAEFAVVDFLIFTALSILLGFAWIGISLGLSTATASTSRAAAIAFGFWMVFEFLWSLVVSLLVWASNGFSGGLFITSMPDWAMFLNVLPPTASFSNANGVISEVLGASGENTPWFTEPWFGLVVLVAWIVVPVTLGFLRFRSSDL